MRSTSLMLAAAMALGATAASAATTTNVFATTGLVATELDSSLGSPLTVPKFNPALGTLIQVDWIVALTVSSEITITNNASTSQSGDAGTQVEFTLSDMVPFAWDLALQDGLVSDGTLIDLVTTDTGDFTLAPSESRTFNLSQTDTFSGSVPGGFLGTLADWTAPGSAGFEYLTDTNLLVGFGGGQVGATQSTDARINLSVTYTYEPTDTPPIPVPAALPLLATAIGALGVARKFRKRA